MQVKSTFVAVLVLAVICAVILLVDHYFSDTLIWWFVALPVCGGYLYFRVNRDTIRGLLNKEKQRSAPRSELSISLTDPESGRSFQLTDVAKIEVETTGDGPFDEDLYWIFHLQSAPPVRMAGGVAHGLGIFDILEQFDGVHYDNVIQSASSVVPALSPIWEKE